MAGEVRVPGDVLAGGRDAAGDLVEVLDHDPGMGLASRAEFPLDAEVQLQAAGAEPGPAPAHQDRRLLNLGHPEDVDEEGPRALLLAGGHGELYVVEAGEHAVECARVGGRPGSVEPPPSDDLPRA
jgi:hypothetical protein